MVIDEERPVDFTKFGHACTRIDKAGQRLVIDPGGLTPEDVLDGATAILVTHEHWDHFSEERLRTAVDQHPGLAIWTNGAVADQLDGLGSALHVVGDGDLFTAAGFDIEVHGERHAEIHRDIPRIGNVGFLIDGSLFHPGDALTVPERPVETLMLPVHAPWSKIGELIDWVREVAPQQAIAVHDGLLNDMGLTIVGGLLGDAGPGIATTYRRMAPGEHTHLS